MTEKKYLTRVGKTRIESEDGRHNLDASHVLVSTRRLLYELRRCRHTATFFVVGEIYDWYQSLIKEIREAGHEVAYHCHTHTPLDTEASLRQELHKSREFIAAFRPKGFRAPRATITSNCLAELAKQGFLYDSSSYGPFSSSARMEGILEVPISTYSLREVKLTLPRPLSTNLLFNLEIPFGSGYFISLLSQLNPSLMSYFIEKSNRKGQPSVLCLHPWQLFRNQEESLLEMGFARLLLFPYGISCDKAFEHLVRRYKFCSMLELLENLDLT